ncbi:hypothetical protein AAHE18_18G063200 [Arachis hypogaea]
MMNKQFGTCEIVHIPEKEPHDLHNQPTEFVFASAIDPQNANHIVRRLNQIAPLENLRHVKRIQKKVLERGQVQLSVILCAASEGDNQLDSVPPALQELISSFQLSPFITKVCKYAATSKEEWQEQCKIWPTSYHPRTYNIDGITGFSDENSECIFKFMQSAMELATSDGVVVNAAVIVDPSAKQIISRARDQSSYYCHPLRHAAMVAVESSAARDRYLFPSEENNGEKPLELDHENPSSTSSPAKRQKTVCTAVENDDDQLKARSQSSNQLLERPYLCTGYDIYLVWEPCTMCAMALVHQRIRRIFYAFPNRNAGALGSVHRLQGEKSLNHHYAVFRVLLPEEALHKCHTEVPQT